MTEQQFDGNRVVIAGSAFALGVIVGLVLRDAGRQWLERASAGRWHRDYERTITYGDNLPDSLSRREPAPQPGQSRYGGTGALGVHPASAESGKTREPRAR